MQHYIQQFIHESQLQYPSLYKYPVDVLRHLFFTNGNGYSVLDGNPCVSVDFYKEICFEHYYSDGMSFEQCKEYAHDYIIDQMVHEDFKRKKQMHEVMVRCNITEPKTDDELYKEACDETYKEFNAIVPLDIERTDDINYWIEQIKDNKYLSLLLISDGFFMLQNFNNNTEESLLNISKIIAKSYLQFYRSIDDEMLKKYRNPYGSIEERYCIDSKDKIIGIINNDIELLEQTLNELP